MNKIIVATLIVFIVVVSSVTLMAYLGRDTSETEKSNNNKVTVTQPYKEDYTLLSENCSDGVIVDIEKIGTNSFTATIRYDEDSMVVFVNVYRSITGDTIDPGYYLTFRVDEYHGMFIRNLKDNFWGNKIASWQFTDNAKYSGTIYTKGFDVEFQTSNFLTNKAGFSFTSVPIS